MDLHISGLTAVVTGGTRGIGKAIVSSFLAEGAKVAFCARKPDEVKQAETELSKIGTVTGSVLNVRDRSAINSWVSDTAERFGSIDMVVSNVSALVIPNTLENWKEAYEVDMMGTVYLVEACLPHLEKSKNASIISISSVSGREVDFASGPYGTIKSAIIAYMAGIAYQLAPKGIRANSVSPGNTYHEGGVWPSIEKSDPELFSYALGLNPTGRMGTPEEIADSVVFLSSPRSGRTTGANLLIDGALTKGIQF